MPGSSDADGNVPDGNVPDGNGPVGALSGITVLDCGLILQGPQAGQLLSDLGANVIKVEVPEVGDTSRWIPLSFPDDMRAPWFIAANRGKRSMTLDLRTPAGRNVFLKMAATADVVLSNFAPGTMDRWGLGFDDLSAVNPGVIMASASAYGAVGPDAERKGADLGGQAQGGLVSTTVGRPGGAHPVSATIADHIGSQNLSVAILAALVARNRTGRGQQVEVSLFGGQIFAQAPELTAYFLTGDQARTRHGGHPRLMMYYGVFATSDGHLALVGIPSEDARRDFWTALGMPEHADNEAFNAPVLTTETQDEVFSILTTVFATRTTAEWADLLRATGIRYAPVQGYAEIAEDEGAFANGYLQRVDHPEWGEVVQIGCPIRLSDTPAIPGQIAPELGQHTEEVLLEFGWTWDDIGKLRDGGAI